MYKVVTADSSKGLYYVLKADGNIYGYTIVTKDRNVPPKMSDGVAVFKSIDYVGSIIDFNYNGNSASTFVRTNNKVFRMKASNYNECSKYVDIQCEYGMTESPVFEEYKGYILVYNGFKVITTYKKVFSVNG